MSCFTNKLCGEPSFHGRTLGQTLVGKNYQLLRNWRRSLSISFQEDFQSLYALARSWFAFICMPKSEVLCVFIHLHVRWASGTGRNRWLCDVSRHVEKVSVSIGVMRWGLGIYLPLYLSIIQPGHTLPYKSRRLNFQRHWDYTKKIIPTPRWVFIM